MDDSGYQHLSKLSKIKSQTSDFGSKIAKEKFRDLQKMRLKTTFIGALDKFERFFGSLWGHGLHEDDLTEEQYEFRQRWNMVRTLILDGGNGQIRAMDSDLERYKILFETFHLELPVKQRKGN